MNGLIATLTQVISAQIRKPIGVLWALFLLVGVLTACIIAQSDRALFMLIWGTLSIFILFVLVIIYDANGSGL